jgi:hypothetical protein
MQGALVLTARADRGTGQDDLLKRQWTREDLAEHWTLDQAELALLTNKARPTRLGFAILLATLARYGPAAMGNPHGCNDGLFRGCDGKSAA